MTNFRNFFFSVSFFNFSLYKRIEIEIQHVLVTCTTNLKPCGPREIEIKKSRCTKPIVVYYSIESKCLELINYYRDRRFNRLEMISPYSFTLGTGNKIKIARRQERERKRKKFWPPVFTYVKSVENV